MSMSSSTIENTQNSSETIGSSNQAGVVENLTNDLHRLNQTVRQAVEAGVSVELVRSARHHGGSGNWGDLMVPVINRG